MQFEIAKSLSVTESLSLIASMVFGKAKPTKAKADAEAATVDQMMAFAREINGGRG
jgi:hypothetical protein